jgi:hypothetical protein
MRTGGRYASEVVEVSLGDIPRLSYTDFGSCLIASLWTSSYPVEGMNAIWQVYQSREMRLEFVDFLDGTEFLRVDMEYHLHESGGLHLPLPLGGVGGGFIRHFGGAV